MALSEACKVSKRLREVLNELGEHLHPTIISQENTAFIYWSTERAAKQVTRHKQIKLRYHFVHNKLKDGSVRLFKVGTENMEALFQEHAGTLLFPKDNHENKTLRVLQKISERRSTQRWPRTRRT